MLPSARTGDVTLQNLTVQRQSQPGTEGETRSPSGLPPDLEQVLQELFPTPNVPPYEAIGATTSAEPSRGELTERALKLWKREHLEFTKAVRKTAESKKNKDEESTGPRPLPVHSLASDDTPYELRWALTWSAANYRRSSRLPDVARLLRKGSPFTKALSAEFDKKRSVSDPTAERMRQSVFNTVQEMWKLLPAGQAGQLVVYFSGHGGGGSICGVDEACLEPDELKEWARMARDFAVHIVYILDTCNVGQAVSWAQAEVHKDLRRRVAELSSQEQGELRTRLRAAGKLGNILGLLNANLTKLYSLRRWLKHADLRKEAEERFRHVIDLMLQVGKLKEEFPAELSDFRELTALQNSPFLTALVGQIVPSAKSIAKLRREIAPLLQQMSKRLNEMLDEIRSGLQSGDAEQKGKVRGASSPPAPVAEE